MADVFISYSKSHRSLTERLARLIEERGISVWWDTDLIAGESFRHRILQELTAAKAVIVIWTKDAVTSEYVLSEAERARVAKKLIQVRVAGVEPGDLPPPFDTAHVPLITDERAIFGGLARLGVGDGQGGEPIALADVTTGDRSVSAPADDAGRAAAAFGWFTGALNDGLKDTSRFAGELRLGRRGLMTDREAANLLREFIGGLKTSTCRIDQKSLTAKPDGRRPEALKALATMTCDLTDRAGQARTERFPLEIEVTRQTGGGDRITGLWQPDTMILWQPR